MGSPQDGPEVGPQLLRDKAQQLEQEAAEADKYVRPEPPRDPNAPPYTEYNPNASLEPEAVAWRKRQEAEDLRRQADDLEQKREAERNEAQAENERQVAAAEEQRRETAELQREDTGHYDDGHAFGWRKSAPPLEDPTGHYDDAHAFGWGKPTEEPVPEEQGKPFVEFAPDHGVYVNAMAGLASPPATPKRPTAMGGFGVAAPGGIHQAPVGLSAVALNYLRQNRSAQIGIILALVVGAFLGTEMLRAGAQQNAQLAAPAATASAAASAAAVLAAGGPIDPCALVTAQEAAAILGGQGVTARGTTPPGAQCDYHPLQRVVFSFQESSRVAQIRIDDVVLTVVTGPQAASRYAAKASPKPDPDNQTVSGLGDKAIYGGAASDLTVLRGTAYVNVAVQGDRDWGDGATRYEDVFQKYLSVLMAFARDALSRLP